jgi:hypothetical protein
LLFVVDTKKQTHVCDNYVVGLVHGHKCVLDLTSKGFTTWHAVLETESPSSVGYVIATVAAMIVSNMLHK